MGLIKAVVEATSSTLKDEWLEYIYCDRLPDNVLMRKGTAKNKTNNNGNENIITNGSKIVVAEDQFLVVVSDGKIVDFTAEAGRYTFDKGTEPSMLYGGFGKGLIESFKTIGSRFTTAGNVNHDQRVYFINMRDIIGNKFGTPNPVPFRDSEFGITVDIRCHGEYVLKVTDPIKFFTSLGGNIESDYVIDDEFESQFGADFMQALQPALASVALQKVSYDMLPGAVIQISDAVKQQLEPTWGENGINVVRVSIKSVTPTDESANMIKAAQKDRIYAMNPAMQGARANAAASEAMVGAANNANGAMNGFMGIGMMNQGGAMFGANISEQSTQGMVMGAMNSPEMMQQQSPVQPSTVETTTQEPSIVKEETVESTITKDEEAPKAKFCTNCGTPVTGNFCTECGTKAE
ncbi:MAG: SPFH domain-containing protein [Bacilli bacterium]|nr:SPFH domain-containing protein [Bacilli bacterium]